MAKRYLSKNKIFSGKWFYLFLVVLLITAVVLLGYTRPLEFFENKPTLEYFYMKQCGHCQAFWPIWQKVVTAINTQKINVVAKDYDINGDGKARGDEFKVTAVPTIYLVKNGTKTEYTGDRTEEKLIEFLKNNV